MNDTNTLAPIAPPVDVDKLDTAKPLPEIFAPFQATLEKWEAKVNSLDFAKLKADLKKAREERIALYSESLILGDVSDLSEEAFSKMLEDAKFLRQARLDASEKAEKDRKEKEEADRLERVRIADENAKLKAEADEREKKTEAERKRVEEERIEERKKLQEQVDKQTEIARKEAAESAKARAKLMAKEIAEASDRERQEADRRAEAKVAREAAAAPDKAKLQAFANSVRALPIPVLKTIDVDLTDMVEAFAKSIEVRMSQ